MKENLASNLTSDITSIKLAAGVGTSALLSDHFVHEVLNLDLAHADHQQHFKSYGNHIPSVPDISPNRHRSKSNRPMLTQHTRPPLNH
jgi:hypothetical protein